MANSNPTPDEPTAAESHPGVRTCRNCGAAIVWATTKRGKPWPLDAEPSPAGSWVLSKGVVYYITNPEFGLSLVDRYVSHSASCPDAADFRRSR